MCCQLQRRGGILATQFDGRARPMNFAVYFSIYEFRQTLQPNATVHIITFRDPKRDTPHEPHAMLLLTSDGGVEGGTIRACQIMIADKGKDEDEALKFGGEAFSIIEAFLKAKGFMTREGMILTTGLQEAIDHFSFDGSEYSLTDLRQTTKASMSE